MTAKADRAPGSEGERAPADPSSGVGVAGSAESSLVPTAIHPAIGPECPLCHKANHLGVTRCVFCGTPISVASVAPAVAFAPPPASERRAWSEAPVHVVASGDVSGAATSPTERPPPAPEGDGAAPSHARLQDLSDSFDRLPASALADPLIGVVVAERYRILEPLGRGGMGIVYKVEHTRIGKLLAMKLLTGELSRNPDVVRRFKQEALTVSKLSSPNTVQVFDFGAAEGLTYLVMELVAGEDLGRVLRTQGPMPFARLGKIVVQVCTSLAEAHQKGIVHRDIKPENIMLLRARDGTDVAKVLDFGLAKLREGEGLNDVTSQGAIVGTPYFMSPEQIRGEPVDPRSDIYALGALMYRALTGHYPFNGPTPMAVFTRHLTEAPTPPHERVPERGIPPGVSRIVLKALTKSANERYQKVEELQAALIEEVRAAGTSSVEDLLDSGQLRRLAKVAAEAEGKGAGEGAPKAEIATRDEVEAYERKLRRQKWGAYLSAVLVAAIAAVAAVKIVLLQTRTKAFVGVEVEPNNTPAEATRLPFGRTVTGYLGKRIDPTHGDRDFYAVDVPSIPGETPPTLSTVRLRVTALPNFAMCTMVYRQGLSTALGQYCVGRPGKDLVIPALRLEPGRYLVAVMQDLDPYGAVAPFVHENVSDPYTLTVEPSPREPGAEVEPNDQVASANRVAPGSSITGTVAWAGDEDLFCVAADAPGNLRWKVRTEPRAGGAVIEATPMRGAQAGAPVRVHAGMGKLTATDVQSPWTSEPIAPEGGLPRCLRVRLTNDPWAGAQSAIVPSGGSEPYVVEVEAVP